MGGKKLYHLPQEQFTTHGIKLGRDALFDLPAANNLLIRRRKRKAITTFSRHNFRRLPPVVATAPEWSGGSWPITPMK